MKQFTSVHDVQNLNQLVQDALSLKSNPYAYENLGKHKTLGLVFMNPSLRTRLSTQKAAMNLGMQVMVMNMDKEGWALETQDGIIMNGSTVEHMREAAAVMGQYCDILGLRSFPKLVDREEDYQEDFFNKFVAYCGVPVVSLESATRHPLQSLADLVTIKETQQGTRKPKVVLAWAPHIKALPQAVPNSFAEWMCKAQQDNMLDFSIAQPQGYELLADFTKGAQLHYNLEEALQDADYIYVKNWSSYAEYGQVLPYSGNWMLTADMLKSIPQAKVMHCLPVRRNLELAAEVLDGPQSLVIQEAGNRLWAAQAVLKNILEALA